MTAKLLGLGVAVGLALVGCTHPAPADSPDRRFLAQATTILGYRPTDAAHLIRSVKVLCADPTALALSTAAQPVDASADALVRAGLAIYCPTRVPVFDLARTERTLETPKAPPSGEDGA